jgi:hypothetical protein
MRVKGDDIMKVESMYYEFIGKSLFLNPDSIIVRSLSSQRIEMPFPNEKVFKFSKDET